MVPVALPPTLRVSAPRMLTFTPQSMAREAIRGWFTVPPLKETRAARVPTGYWETLAPPGYTSRRAASVEGLEKMSCTGPSSATLPPSRRATREQMASMTLIWWVMTTTVTPSLALRSFKSSRMETVVVGSRAEVASSQRRTLGSVARARAMATRCFCPPESWAG